MSCLASICRCLGFGNIDSCVLLSVAGVRAEVKVMISITDFLGMAFIAYLNEQYNTIL